MADIEFTDNSVQIKAALDDAITAWLYEAGGALEAQTKKNTSNRNYGKRDVKNSWHYKVNESKKEARVGSNLEASYWEEFGTGEHALYHNGRKGWWVYVEGNDTPSSKQKMYTEREAKAVAASMRRKGLDAHATNGNEPNRPLFTAFNTKKASIIRRLQAILKGRFNG
jgi:hypothetical protein